MTDFIDLIVDLTIFAGGMLTMGFAMLPSYFRAWDDGYKAAENIYNNWHLGFSQGFEAGVTAILTELEEVHKNETVA